MLSEKWTFVKNNFPEYEEKVEETFLIEDMFQANYNNFTIDSGWYGGENGHFITFLIKDSNWEYPLVRIISNKISDIKWAIEVCEDYVENFDQ